MKLSMCPFCHGAITLDAICQDEAGRELMAIIIGMDTVSGTSLASYLTLFRSNTRYLSNDKALKLAKEAIALGELPSVVRAMQITVDSIHNKRHSGEKTTVFKDHSYLKKVLVDIPVQMTGSNVPAPMQPGLPLQKKSKAAIAHDELERFANDDPANWLKREICYGLQGFVPLSYDGTPAADTIYKTAEMWHESLKSGSAEWIEELDKKRLKDAFSQMTKSIDRWPIPKDIKNFLLPRSSFPKRQELKLSKGEVADNVEKLRGAIRSNHQSMS